MSLGPESRGGAVALAVTMAVAPWVRRHLLRQGVVDVPNHRSSHVNLVPRGGGLACLAGVAGGLATLDSGSRPAPRTMLGIGAIALVGLADDRLGHVRPTTRLAVQCVAGGAFAATKFVSPLTAVGTAGVVNVVNFMDGINGITGTTAFVWGTNAWMLGRHFDSGELQALGAVTAGAGLGFLPFNVPEAQLFLGDVGSYLFGGTMAAGIAHTTQRPALMWLVIAPLLPYGLDAAQAVLRRSQQGAPLTEAHREHAYQRLVDSRGLSHTTVATIHATVAATIAVTSRAQRPWIRFGVTSLLAAGYVALPSLLPENLETNA